MYRVALQHGGQSVLTVQVLCLSGADLLAETPTGYIAMHFAAMHGHVHCMKVSSTSELQADSQTSAVWRKYVHVYVC